MRFKGLKHQELRDHMNDLELIFTMLGEAATTEIARNRDARGFTENRKVARKGGNIAGDARKRLERESGRKVATPRNYLGICEKETRSELNNSSVDALPVLAKPSAAGKIEKKATKRLKEKEV